MKILSLLSIVFVLGCSEQLETREYGGTMEIILEKGDKLVNISWKDNDLWYLVRPMNPEDSAITYYYKESAETGKNGTVIIHEQK